MQHMVNFMTKSPYCKNVWFVDLGASNHMTNHVELFNAIRNLEKLGYVETGDDNAHPIAQVGNG